MGKNRLEAFSDGVLAIIITIMVLGLNVPHGTDATALKPVLPVLLAYALSFLYIGIYWTNHHHMLHTVHKVTGPILWANLHLLFWLSLFPFTTGWMSENHFAAGPAALYGVVLLMAAIAYWTLQQLIIASQGPQSLLKRAIKDDWKGKLSPVLYAIGIGLAFRVEWLALAIYILVALMWLIPDRRIERMFAGGDS
ncbi:MAG: TMEM175 family protein [Steroidobacteraceae bacterium]